MLEKLKEDIEKLSTGELQELLRHINDITGPNVSYQKRGEYWYGFFRHGDRIHCIYVGKEKREINPLEELKKKAGRKK